MPEHNQIIRGDSIDILNQGSQGWMDLCFADPPFNVGYLYHNYDDEKDVDEYVAWSEKWMGAVEQGHDPGRRVWKTPVGATESCCEICVANVECATSKAHG